MATAAHHIFERRAKPRGDQRFTALAISSFCLTLMCLVALVKALSGETSGVVGPVLASYAMVSLWAGLIVCGVAQAIALLTPGRWRPDLRAGWLVLAMLLSGVTLPLFQIFKQVILPTRGFPLDPLLAKADNILFLGHDAWEVTHAVFGNVSMTRLFDAAYAVWLPMMFLFPAVTVMAFADLKMRARLMACWLAAWILIASLAAWIFGSAGPCYYNALVGPHAGFQSLNANLTAISATAQANGQGIAALEFQDMLLRQMYGGSFVSAGGISAMPSMHVAMATLFAITGFRIARPLGWVLAAYAVTIWIGSVHLGWHYALDGLVGAAMMAAIWRTSVIISHR